MGIHYVKYPDINIQIKYPNKMINADAPRVSKSPASKTHQNKEEFMSRHSYLVLCIGLIKFLHNFEKEKQINQIILLSFSQYMA